MSLEDALRAGTANSEQLAQLEQRVQALESGYLPDAGGITNRFNINQEGEVENVENVAINELVSEEGDIIEGGPGGKARTLKRGKAGQVLRVGVGGALEWAEPSAGEQFKFEPFGTHSVVGPVKWAMNTGTKLIVEDATVNWQPTSWGVAALADGEAGAAAIGGGWYSGITMSALGESVATGTSPYFRVQFSELPLMQSVNGGKRIWIVNRANEESDVYLYFLLFSYPNLMQAAFTNAGLTKAGAKYSVKVKLTKHTKMLWAMYSNAAANLATENSGTTILNSAAKYKIGNNGAAGLQLYFPTAEQLATEAEVELFFKFAAEQILVTTKYGAVLV